MPSSNLLDNLRHLKRNAETTRGQVGPWRRAAQDLFSNISNWLQPAVTENLLAIHRVGVTCNHEGNVYECPAYTLVVLDGRQIDIRPTGLVPGEGPLGRMGRIDVASGPQVAQLLWTSAGWRISRSPHSDARAHDLLALTQITFLELLNEFVPGPTIPATPALAAEDSASG